MKKKVVVGMSGGVDSSVAAYLLKKEGYDVIGVTMQIWQDLPKQELADQGGCCGLSAVEDARRVANMLDIPYYVMNFKDVFSKMVVDYFVDEYLEGRTPNPCIACNRYVKWEALLDKSIGLGADYIATGHYARVKQLESGRYTLEQSVTIQKDQTYALFNLTQEQLKHTLMPVGDYSKDEIREIAREMGLCVADKPDSQEICFIPDNDYAGFIEKNAKREIPKPGNFVDRNGVILGTHKGITHYTIGQRKKLNLSMGRPVFVTQIRPQTNEVVIGEGEDVFGKEVIFRHINRMGIESWNEDDVFYGKIRYGQKAVACRVIMLSDEVAKCVFEEPVRAITPGQAIVLYQDNCVMLGGTILSE